ncbi:site-specific integrase [Synergistaceae bacterium OttesenSCG-928-I11]|nr:site-specific integrase [Synergistaceae bacterium OttesenSCG-928-I11]
MQIKITPSVIQNLKPQEKTYRVVDTLLKGLTIIVRPTGKKTWYVDYRRPNGTRTHHMIGTTTLFTVTEARELARDFLAAIARGEDPKAEAEAEVQAQIDEQNKTLTLGKFINEIYGPWVKESRKTGRETLLMIQRAFEPLFKMDVTQITLPQLETWRNHQKKERGIKASSLNREVTALKAALNWGVTMEIFEKTSIAKLKPLKEVDSRKIVRYLSDDERSRLMQALEDREKQMREERRSHNAWLKSRELDTLPEFKHFTDHLKPMILISLNTGIRQNALFSLEWGDVNFEDETIFLRADVDKASKSNYIPMNDVVIDTLRRWREQAKSAKPGALIFPSPKNGKKIDNCRKAWEALLKKAEIENFRWHDMRHDFASQLVMMGVDLNTVRELLCHSDMKMTLRYAHLAPTVKKSAVEMLKHKHVKVA